MEKQKAVKDQTGRPGRKGEEDEEEERNRGVKGMKQLAEEMMNYITDAVFIPSIHLCLAHNTKPALIERHQSITITPAWQRGICIRTFCLYHQAPCTHHAVDWCREHLNTCSRHIFTFIIRVHEEKNPEDSFIGILIFSSSITAVLQFLICAPGGCIKNVNTN